MSHPRLCLRTSLGDRAVSRGSPGPIGTHVARDRRVSPYLVSRVATPYDDTGEQARSVNLLETWRLVSRRGQRGNPLPFNIHRWVAKLAVDKTVGSSLTVLGSCRKTGVSPRDIWDPTGSPTGSLSTFGESGLNVQSGHSEDLVFGSKVRAVLHRDWGH